MNHNDLRRRNFVLQAAIVASCLTLCIGVATTSASTTPTIDPRLDMVTALQAMGPHPSLGDQAKVFGRFVGTWDAAYTEFSKDGKAIHSSGEFIVGWVMDGRAIQDVFIIYPSTNKERFIGTTLRYFDPKSGTWRVTFVDPENDSVVRFTGSAVGYDRIVLLSQEADDKKTRWSFNEIRPDSFVFRDEESRDGGKTWRLTEEDHMKRRAAIPAAPCSPLVVCKRLQYLYPLARLHRVKPILKSLAKASAQPQVHFGFQDNLVVASILQFQPMNPIEPYNDRAVNTDKSFLAQVAL
jgi:hypothetical protein